MCGLRGSGSCRERRHKLAAMSHVRTQPPVITRFAPSPTGHLHIGGARSALFCWAYARRHGGHFLLRIEDTDQARSSEESARGIMEDLAWLGIDWDEGPALTLADGRTVGGDPRKVAPFFQAQRVATYNQYIDWLVEQERAYPAFDSHEEIDAQRTLAKSRKETYRYDRMGAMGLPLAERLRRMRSGEPHVIRLLAPSGEIVVKDEVLGEVRYAAGELDDFVLRKADGFPTYHFAVVIDDELMGITHVMRAQEHLNNTPRHVALQQALRRIDTGAAFRTPIYAHMPLIMNMDNSKMSKRDKAKTSRVAAKAAMAKDATLTVGALAERVGVEAGLLQGFVAGENDRLDVALAIAAKLAVMLPEIEVSDFRENGYSPEAIVNFLGLLGWNPGMKLADGKDLEKFDASFLASNFSLERIGKTSAKFDRVKLASFNGDVLAAMTPEAFAAGWAVWCGEHAAGLLRAVGVSAAQAPGNERWCWLASAVKGRAKTYGDAVRPAAFVLLADDGVAFDAGAVAKHLLGPVGATRGLDMLERLASRLADVQPFEPVAIHGLIEQAAKDEGLANMGPLAQTVRIAMTGTVVSPPLGEMLAVLGRDSVMKRLRRCIAVAGGM